LRLGSGHLLALLIACVVFWIAYDDGSYGLSSRATLAIAVCWAIVIGLGLGVFTLTRLPSGTMVVGGILAALTLWTLASVYWAPSAEAVVTEFNRSALYLGIYVLVVLASTRSTVGRWTDALTLAVVCVGGVALVSRLFQGSFPDRDLPTFLPAAEARLSFPLGYWNGLGVFVALGIPLLLRIALVGRRDFVRAVAVGLIPALASTLYLTSSRGGSATALVATLAFVVLTERRWRVLVAILLAGAGSAVAIVVLNARPELVNGPLEGDLVRDQGLIAALFIALTSVTVAVAFTFASRVLGRRLRPRRAHGLAVAVVAAIAATVAVVAVHPVERFEHFKSLPDAKLVESGDFVQTHLLSGGGSGRWQFWTAAVDQWRDHPVLGQGAGTYESWWAEHASFSYFVRNAHSVYLEVLGELGIVGFVLVVSLAVVGVGVGVRRTLRLEGEMRVTMAALTSVFAAYAVAAGFDWLWELTAVTVVALVALGLISGPSTTVLGIARAVRPGALPDWTTRHRAPIVVVVVLTFWLLLAAQVITLLSDREIAKSQHAVTRGDLSEATIAAEAARNIEPWAATPYLQLTLISEAAGDLPEARIWNGEAIERDRKDWRLWLVAARIEAKLGRMSAAEDSLRTAIGLNPRSPLFAELLDDGTPR
jgi:hypothetical protein